MKYAYPIVLTPDEEGFTVFIPDMNINTQGGDLAEAMEMARDAIGLMGIDMEDDGKTLPTPSEARAVKAAENEIILLDELKLNEVKTKAVVKMLKDVNAAKKAMIVTAASDADVLRAANNIPDVKVSHVGMLNVVDILKYDSFIVTKDAIGLIEELYNDEYIDELETEVNE